MGSTIETFEQAMQLDTAALRGLLTSGRPEQRVWAMWALALRQHGVPDLIPRTAVEPDPGVRRTLAVVLASHGETDLLVALARHDPVIAVRASAMQLVTRLAAGGAIAPSVVLEAAQREPEIQAAILAALDASAPEFLIGIAAPLLQHGAPALQVEAFEALVRNGSAVSLRRAIAWLGNASSPLAVEACRRWAHAETPEGVVRVLAPAPADLRQVALEALRGASWSVVEPLICGDHALLLRAGYHAHPQLPIELLAQVVRETADVPALTALVKRLQVLPALVPELVPHVAALRVHGEQRREAVRAEADAALLALEQRLAMLSSGREPEDDALEKIHASWRLRRQEDRQLAMLQQELDRLSGMPDSSDW